jgi:hypothetical protein
VNGPLWEDGHFARRQYRLHRASIILRDCVGVGLTFRYVSGSLWAHWQDILTHNGDNVVGCSWVIVGRQHSTRAQLYHGHRELISHHGLIDVGVSLKYGNNDGFSTDKAKGTEPTGHDAVLALTTEAGEKV